MLSAILVLGTLQAPDTVRYDIRFPNVAHHEARISVSFPGTGRDTLEVWISRSSPGRYALHEFAKNVHDVTATAPDGTALAVVRPDPYRWLVATGGRGATFHYTLFADRADGTYSQVDASHAHLNAPATLAWARGLERLPASLTFTPPAGSGWRAGTQLLPTADPFRFTAPDLQYLMDSPVELSDFHLARWTVPRADGSVDTVRMAVHHLGTEAEVTAFAAEARAVVAEQMGIFGELAPFDHHTYTFIADYHPWASGDGMEHRNSTILSSSASLEAAADGLLGTVSHEFFHSWNVERIRPAGLEPFDFTRANPSDALWFAEGFTSYYDDLTIRRAGLSSDAQYARGLGQLVDAVIRAPGRRHRSPMEMSRLAPFVDAASSIDPTSFGTTFLSYYTWGAGIGLGLDLTIRGRFPGKSLDGFMRRMWVEYGRTSERYAVPRPYAVDDLERELGAYTGDAAFAREFFARYIRGRDVVDYATLLAQAGFVLRPRAPEASFLGSVGLDFDSRGGTIETATHPGEPLYEAGLDRGDRIVSIGGTPLVSDSAWQAVKAAHRPGDTAPLVVQGRGSQRSVPVTFTADPRLELVPLESSGGTLSPAQRAFREAWLASRAGT